MPAKRALPGERGPRRATSAQRTCKRACRTRVLATARCSRAGGSPARFAARARIGSAPCPRSHQSDASRARAPGRRGIARAPLRLAGALAVVASLALAGCGSGGGSGTSVDPATRGARLGSGLRGRRRAPGRLGGVGRARRRAGAHGPGRPLQAPGAGAADAGLPRARLRPRRGALARSARRAVPLLGRLRSRACCRCCSGACSARAAQPGAFPFAAKGSEGAIVLDTQRRREGAVVPRRRRPRTRARTRPATAGPPTR